MSSATDELRRLLDERGVEHYDHEDDEPLRDLSEAGPDPATSWRMGDASVCAVPDKNGTLDIWIDHATPEQAIAATLGNDGVERTNDGVDGFNIGRTTTRNTTRTVYGNKRPVCEVCGYGIGDKRWHYCPKCGARIVEE